MPSSAVAQVAPHVAGELSYMGRTWDVEVSISHEGLAPAVELTMAALWRAGVEAENVVVRGDSIAFDLPFDIGRFQGVGRGGGITGSVHFTEGGEEELTLVAVDRPVIRTEDATFERGDVTIGATLALPPGTGPFPAIAVLHGGGDSSREAAPYAFWADYLPRRGIAVLLYDKRGNGASTGSWRTVGFGERADDVVAGLRRIAEHPAIDRDRLGLLAVSQGSWVASLVIDRYPEIAFAVHVAGPVVPVVDADTHALVTELRREGWAPDDIEERVALWRLSADAIRHPDSDAHWRRLQDAIDRVRDRAWYEASPYDPPRTGWFRDWYRNVLDYDPAPALERAKVPMLWMYGDRDSESDVSANVAILTELRVANDKDYSIAVFPEAGHGILGPVDRAGRNIDPLTAAPGFFDVMISWLEARTCCERKR